MENQRSLASKTQSTAGKTQETIPDSRLIAWSLCGTNNRGETLTSRLHQIPETMSLCPDLLT